MDAIIVPTARPASSLRNAVRLAEELGCTLLALCSEAAEAGNTVAAFGSERVVAVNVPKNYRHELLRFTTSEIDEARVSRRTDTSLKRNLGLLLARMNGWQRIVFLDDDIAVDDSSHLSHAAALLDSHDVAGLSIGGFPDNSVVCHAHREAGGRQDTFVGGGALAVNPQRTPGFFPDIYNEDWFFLLDSARIRRVALTGLATQQAYDPFSSPDRAASEEFGDVLAEGVFWLLDNGKRVKDADHEYWASFLERRRQFIADVTRRVRSRVADPAGRERILSALDAAERRRATIPPTLLARYLTVWRADRTRWKGALGAVRSRADALTMDVALKELDLKAPTAQAV